MLEFLVDNIFVVFGGKVFQQIVGIPMGTNCAPLPADIFLYSYEAEFIQSLLSTGKKKIASQFNFTYRYIDDVLSINNPDFENDLGQMYPAELEIKDTTESNTSVDNKLSLHLGKTECIMFGPMRELKAVDEFFVKCHGFVIKSTDRVKYLGVTIDKFLKCDLIVENVINKVNTRLKFLYKNGSWLNTRSRLTLS